MSSHVTDTKYQPIAWPVRSLSGLTLLILLSFSPALVIACASEKQGTDSQFPSTSSTSGPENRLQIVASLYPLAYFAERIGGDRIDVSLLIEPGVEAHDFEPTTGDLKKIRSADLVIYSGAVFSSAGFESWVGRALDSLGDDAPPALEASAFESADLLAAPGPGIHSDTPRASGSGESDLDPHVWLDPTLAAVQVGRIEEALARTDPDSASDYRSRAEPLAEELSSLDHEFRSRLGSCRTDTFVTSHAAYEYIAAAYGLEQIAISGLYPAAEPGPGTFAEIAERMKDQGLRHVLAEPIINPRLAQALAAETAAEVLTLHPLENLTPAEAESGETYFSLMRSNLETLSTVLGCENGVG